MNPIVRLVHLAVVAGALAAGLGELAKLQGWRLRDRLLRKAP